jgi:hypothetical protein
MTAIAFTLPDEVAAEIGRRAAQLGMTASTFVASRIPLWLDTEDYMESLASIADRLANTIDEITEEKE